METDIFVNVDVFLSMFAKKEQVLNSLSESGIGPTVSLDTVSSALTPQPPHSFHIKTRLSKCERFLRAFHCMWPTRTRVKDLTVASPGSSGGGNGAGGGYSCTVIHNENKGLIARWPNIAQSKIPFPDKCSEESGIIVRLALCRN